MSTTRRIVADAERNIPLDSDTLIDQLDAGIPHRCIANGESAIDAHRYAAQRELVDELLTLREEDRSGEEDGPQQEMSFE